MSDPGWLQCVQEFPGDQRVFEMFERLFFAAGAPREVALFSREDHKSYVYLLSPAAAKWAHLLTGTWEPAGDPKSQRWAVLIGDARAPGSLGIEVGQHRDSEA